MQNGISCAEFVHLYQQAAYSGGIAQYLSTAKGNIEFEAMVILDLLLFAKGTGGVFFGRGQNYESSYGTWIISLTSNGTFPTMYDIMTYTENGYSYLDFLYDFVAKPGTYYDLLVDISLYPDALNDINRLIVNNCLN